MVAVHNKGGWSCVILCVFVRVCMRILVSSIVSSEPEVVHACQRNPCSIPLLRKEASSRHLRETCTAPHHSIGTALLSWSVHPV